MLEQRLAVVASLLDERLHHEAVDPAHRVGRNLRGEHLANPIVIGLDPLRRAAAANEVRGAEHRHERLPVARDPARVADELRRHRPAADRQRLEEAARLRRERTQPRIEHRRKRGRLMRSRPVDAGVAGQLLQHERTAARLARHAGFVVGRERRVDRKQVADER